MWLGVDYYPEQWDASLMDEDMDNIVELGCNVIRIGEFSWHLMEKREGEYDFSFFDKVIEKARERGLKVIMGTPTAAIPAWLAAKHPDILSEFEDGRKRAFGGRHVYCFNSPVMYEYSERIIRALAEHYREEKAIIAWQIDNELGHEGSDLCFCPRCHQAFTRYLSEKFGGDIDSLNHTYGTAFWSQEYNSFQEIPLPTETITTHNPALRLDWERFRSQSIVDFAAFQIRLLKKILPDAAVIHDFPGGGLDKHCDYSRVAKMLDVAAYNNYPVWGGQKEPLAPHEIAFGLDYIRGLKQKNFWITEAIMGAQGHDVTGFLPRPGQARMWSYQAMARGCSSLLYFRYRQAAKGAEQFCYGILDADNQKRRRFYEAKSFFEDILPYEDVLKAPFRGEAALVYDYDCLAAFRIQRQSSLLDCQKEMKRLYKTFYDVNIPVDVIPSDGDFSGYKVLLLPLLILAKEDIRQRAKAFAAAGGTVVMTYRSAVKDENNNLFFGRPIPVGYDTLAGVSVAETESLQETEAFPVIGQGIFQGRAGTGGIFRDMLAPIDAEVLYTYGDEFYREFAAVTRKRCEKGMVYYLGCSLDDAVLEELMGNIMKESGLCLLPSENGVELVERFGRDGSGKGKRLRFLINHNAFPVQTDSGTLDAFDCRINVTID